MQTDSSPTLQDDRLTTLELKMMDLETTVAELDAVIIRQARDIEQLREERQRLEARLLTLANGLDEQREAADEVPPHY